MKPARHGTVASGFAMDTTKRGSDLSARDGVFRR
jgi:hypothetical protein